MEPSTMANEYTQRAQDLSSVVDRLMAIGRTLNTANARIGGSLDALVGNIQPGKDGGVDAPKPTAIVGRIYDALDKLEAEIRLTEENAKRLARTVSDAPIKLDAGLGDQLRAANYLQAA